MASDGTCAHLLLSEGTHPDSNKAGAFLRMGGTRIFPIKIENPESFAVVAEQLKSTFDQKGFAALADAVCEKYTSQKNGKVVVIVADDKKSLARELDFIQKLLPKVLLVARREPF